MLAYFWHSLGVTSAIFWHPSCVTLAYHAKVMWSECQKYANVTPSQCQKNANHDVIWVLCIIRGDQFLAFLGSKEVKKWIMTYVAVFRWQGPFKENVSKIWYHTFYVLRPELIWCYGSEVWWILHLTLKKATRIFNWSYIKHQQAQLRLCKLGPGTVLIFYKSFAPTSIYM